MRLFASILLLFLFPCLHAQVPSSPFIRHQIQRMIREKIRWENPAAVIDYLRAHPELQKARPGLPAILPQPGPVAAGRSAEVIVNGDDKVESEIDAAINPIDTANIIVGAILQDAENFLSPVSVSVYFTKNFGATWQSSAIQFNPNSGSIVAGGGDPVLAFDATGKAYLSWLVLSLNLLGNPPVALTLYSAQSTNGGQTWSTPVKVAEGTATLDVILTGSGSGSLVDKQWMSVDRAPGSPNFGTLYVSYTQFDIIDSTNQTAHIYVKRKAAAANSYGAAVPAHQATYGIVQFSSIDVDAQGEIHVLFFGGNSENDLALYHAVSTDGGATFLPEVKISDVHFPGIVDAGLGNAIDGIDEGRLYPCPHLAAGLTPGEVYATWSSDGIASQASAGYDVYFARSTDNGATWSTPTTINAGSDATAEQFYPAIDVNANGVIAVSYYDRAEEPTSTNTHYAVAWSFDAGLTFTPPTYASNVPSDFASIGGLNGGFGIGEYTQIVSTPFFTIPFWADGRANDGDIDVYSAILPIYDQSSGVHDVGTLDPDFSVTLANPARDAAELAVRLEKASRLAVQIVNADGQVVYREQAGEMLPAGTYQRRVPLEKGVYLCRIDTDFGFKVKKLVVANR